MCQYRRKAACFAASAALVVSCWNVTAAQSPGASRSIANNEGIFIDATTFKITFGRPTGDASKQVDELQARPLGGATLIFRSGGRLYTVETPVLPAKRDTAEPEEEERPDRIRIEYVPPKNPDHQKLYEAVKERRALETLQQMFSPFRLPLDVTVRLVGCDGVSNAWYHRKGREASIRICYEYLQTILDRTPQEMTPAGLSPNDLIVGQFLYAALHELGHASFDLYDVPIFAREEDAADAFAAYVLLQFRNNQARRLLGGAVYSYQKFIADYKNKPTMPVSAFSNDHGLPETRFYNLLCIAYGSDEKLFADLVEKDYLPKSRAESCKYEFQMLQYAFRDKIAPHIDREKAEAILDMTLLTRSSVRPAEK